MKCTIKWDAYTRTQWDDLLQKCNYSTLLQAYYYAQAMREVKQQGVRHGIIEIDGIEAGIVQMQEVALLGKLIHFIAIDRGPCWFDGFGDDHHINVFLQAINDEFPNRFGRKRRLIPEVLQGGHNDHCVPKGQFESWVKNSKISKYKTYLLDISSDIDDIKSNLKKNWRNSLSKYLKTPVTIEMDETLSTLSDFLSHYTIDRAEKNYGGASAKFTSVMAKYATFTNNCMIFNAMDKGQIIGSIMVFIHGQTATYQIGWANDAGKSRGAHYLLLWHAIGILKSRNVTKFDLGGYNDENEGIQKFKTGLGGQDIALIGSYY